MDFCVDALREALTRSGRTEIFNTYQGTEFTIMEFVEILKTHQVRISMDGSGHWRDNIFVERLWRSIIYENVYLHAYNIVSAARSGLVIDRRNGAGDDQHNRASFAWGERTSWRA